MLLVANAYEVYAAAGDNQSGKLIGGLEPEQAWFVAHQIDEYLGLQPPR